jgi:hypothetical protein
MRRSIPLRPGYCRKACRWRGRLICRRESAVGRPRLGS